MLALDQLVNHILSRDPNLLNQLHSEQPGTDHTLPCVLTIVSIETCLNDTWFGGAFPAVDTSVGFPQNTTQKTAGRKK